MSSGGSFWSAGSACAAGPTTGTSGSCSGGSQVAHAWQGEGSCEQGDGTGLNPSPQPCKDRSVRAGRPTAQVGCERPGSFLAAAWQPQRTCTCCAMWYSLKSNEYTSTPTSLRQPRGCRRSTARHSVVSWHARRRAPGRPAIPAAGCRSGAGGQQARPLVPVKLPAPQCAVPTGTCRARWAPSSCCACSHGCALGRWSPPQAPRPPRSCQSPHPQTFATGGAGGGQAQGGRVRRLSQQEACGRLERGAGWRVGGCVGGRAWGAGLCQAAGGSERAAGGPAQHAAEEASTEERANEGGAPTLCLPG